MLSFANLPPKSSFQRHFTHTIGQALTNAQILMTLLHKHKMGMNQCWLLVTLFHFVCLSFLPLFFFSLPIPLLPLFFFAPYFALLPWNFVCLYFIFFSLTTCDFVFVFVSQGKDIMFRFIIEYSSLRYFGP